MNQWLFHTYLRKKYGIVDWVNIGLLKVNNHISRNEIRALFGADIPGVSDLNIDGAAEMIIDLFIKERLSIEEGKNVLREVMGRFV